MRDFLNLIFTELGKVERVSVLTYLEFCIGYVSLEVRVKTLFNQGFRCALTLSSFRKLHVDAELMLVFPKDVR